MLDGVDVAVAADDDALMHFEPVVWLCLHLNYHLNNYYDRIADRRSHDRSAVVPFRLNKLVVSALRATSAL